MTCNATVFIKNTFLEFHDEDGESTDSGGGTRRSPSTPASWRPAQHVRLEGGSRVQEDGWSSDGSAAAAPPPPPRSYQVRTRQAKASARTMGLPQEHDRPQPTPAWTRLNQRAPTFVPTAVCAQAQKPDPQGRELADILQSAGAAFLALPEAATLQVARERSGGACLHCVFRRPPDAESMRVARDVVKDALLEASWRAEGTHVLGYGLKNPFRDEGRSAGFSATLSYLPPETADEACWDSYEKGFCPRRSQCRWRHPDLDTSNRIRVSFEADAAAPPLGSHQ